VRRLLSLITRCAGYGAACFLLAMMMITVADVTSRALFNKPITGAYDLVQLFLVGSVFFSIPDVFMRDENIVIDFVDHLLGRRTIDLLKAIAYLLGFVFMAVLLWRMVPQALDSVRFNEVSPDLAISMGVHWSLMIFGIALALLPAALIAFASLVTLIEGRERP
jgi:TRAP-type C4-dicarboxylate transport system permease small subunit